MLDWYTEHLYKLYEVKFHEKFFRKSPLPQWVGWYNKYNQAFNYEVYDSTLGVYVKRTMPKKFPDVLEVAFIDNNDFFNTGLCIYRQRDKLYWFSLIFGTDMENRDDVFWTEPVEYGLRGLYYVYVHDVKVPWNNSRIAYIFTNVGYDIGVYAIDVASPGTIHKVDMSAVDEWIADSVLPDTDVDVRLSKTSIEGSTTNYIDVAGGMDIGKHRCFYFTNTTEFPVRGITRIAAIEAEYTEDNDDLVYKTNIPLTLWWRNRPSPDYPPLDGEDENDFEISTVPYNYTGTWASGISYLTNQVVFYNSANYTCTSDHISSVSNNPLMGGSPWIQLSWYTLPLGTAGYSYSIASIPTGNLEYEYVIYRSDADREWIVGHNAIIVRVGGGFAYILLA